MATTPFQAIREAYPEYDGLSDEKLSEGLFKKFGKGQDKFDYMLHLHGKGPRLGPVEAGTASVKSSAQTAYAKGLEVLGFEDAAKAELDEAQARRQDVAERYKREVPTAADVSGLGSAARYAYETAAENVTGMAAPLIGGAIGAIGGTLVGGPVGGIIGGIGGGMAATLPMTLGENIQEQMADGKTLSEVELSTALPAAVISSGLEATINRFLPGVGKAVAGKMFARAARQGIEGGLVEAGTEAVQEALTIAQADPEKLFDMSPEIQARIVEAAIAGGVLGVGVGGVSGTFRSEKPIVDPAIVEAAITAADPNAAVVDPNAAVVDPNAKIKTKKSKAEKPEFPPPAGVAPVGVAPAVVDPAVVAPAVVDPAVVDPAVVAPAGVAPAVVDPAVVDPAVVAPAGVAPAVVDPAVVDPAVVDPNAAAPVFNLPKPLSAAPTKIELTVPFSPSQTATFEPQFVNGVDKALYITGKAKKASNDALYRKFLTDLGFTDDQIQGLGKGIQRHIKTLANDLMTKNAQQGTQGKTSIKLGGPLPIDFIRVVEPKTYASILSKTPAPPTTAQGPSTTKASVPFMMTAQMRASLANLGYTPEAIKNMKPEEAQSILAIAGIPTSKGVSDPIEVVTPPAQAAPAQAAPAQAAPAQAAPAQAAPAQAAPAQAAPVKVSPVQAAPVKAPPVKAPPVKAPPVKTAPTSPVTSSNTKLRFKNAASEFILKSRLGPGIEDLLREIQKGMFPNTSFVVEAKDSKPDSNYGSHTRPIYFGDEHKIVINVASIEADFKAGKRTKLLHTLMHEFSHAIEVQHYQFADPATKAAIEKQFFKERSATGFQRYLFYRAARGEAKTNSADELEAALRAANLSPKEYQTLLTSEKKYLTASEGGGRANVSDDYYRKFEEWVAEKGAQWFAKELAGRVPKTVFEKFQKNVLDSLRNLYDTVTRIMGIVPTDGAFEKMLSDVWGTPDTSLQRKYKGRSSSTNSFVTFIPSSGARLLDQAETVSKPKPGYSANEDRIISKEHPLTEEDVAREDSNPALLTLPSGSPMVAFGHLMSAKKPQGLWSRLFDFITGRVGNESHAQAILRNTVASQLPFMTRAGYEGVGQTIERMQNVQGRVAGLLNFGPLVYNKNTGEITFDQNIGGLISLFKDIGNKRAPELQLYEIAQRELDLRKRGRAGLGVLDPKTQKPLTGADLKYIVDNTPADIKEVAKKHMEFNKKMVQFSVDTGVIPQEKADEWLTMMYTPFYRKEESDPSGNLTLSPAITQMVSEPAKITAFNQSVQVGGAIEADLYGNILKNYSVLTASSLKNIAYNAVAKAAGIGDPKVNEGLGFDQTVIQKVGKPGESVITYRVDGGDQYMRVNDVPMFQALASLSPKQMGAMITAASKVANVLRTGVTIAPGFQIANLWRGIIDTHIKTGMPLLQVVSGTFKGLKQVYMKGASYQAITAATGFGGYGYGSGYRDMSAYMQRVYETNEKGIVTWQLGQKVLDKLEHIGEATEMAPRVAYYDYLVRPKDKGGRGLDSKTAAWEAVNLVNFSRSGAGNGLFGNALMHLIPMVPFLNARVQGLYRLIENGTDGGKTDLFGRPIAKEAWFGTKGGAVGISKAIVSRGLMLTAIEMALNVIVGDEEWYEKLSVEDKIRNNYIQVAGVVIALPRAFEIGSLFGAIPALAMDAFRQRDGSEIATGLGIIATQTFLFNAMPQAVKPLVEVYFANKDSFTGREIETIADKRRPENERADEYTSELATALAQLLPGTSPKQADVLVRGYLGTMGTTFAAVSDSLFSSAGTRPQGAFGDPTSPMGTFASASGLSRFVKDPELMRNKFVKEFYNMKQDLTEVVTSMKDAAEAQDIEALKEKLAADPKAKAAYNLLNRAESRITDLNKQMRNIRNNPNLTAEVKTTRLNQLREAKNVVAENAYKMGKELGY